MLVSGLGSSREAEPVDHVTNVRRRRSVSSLRLDTGALPWNIEAQVTASHSLIWSWIKDLDLVSGAATHQEAVFVCGSGDENKESRSVLWPEERRRCGGRNARS